MQQGSQKDENEGFNCKLLSEAWGGLLKECSPRPYPKVSVAVRCSLILSISIDRSKDKAILRTLDLETMVGASARKHLKL